MRKRCCIVVDDKELNKIHMMNRKDRNDEFFYEYFLFFLYQISYLLFLQTDQDRFSGKFKIFSSGNIIKIIDIQKMIL